MYATISLAFSPSRATLHSAAPSANAADAADAVVFAILMKSWPKTPESCNGRPTKYVVGAEAPVCKRTRAKSRIEGMR